jgi:selenide,water dikinase
MLTRGDKNNREYVGDAIKINGSVTSVMQSALFDPQTAGGLLISLSEENAASFVNQVADSHIIGRVDKLKDYLIEIE